MEITTTLERKKENKKTQSILSDEFTCTVSEIRQIIFSPLRIVKNHPISHPF